MGPALCLASAAGFGLMAVFAKSAYAEGVSVDTLLVVRFGLAAAVLMALCVSRGTLRGLTRRTVLVGMAMGAVGYSAQAGLYLAAVSRVDASQAGLVFSVYPVTVMVAAILIGRERASGRRLAALGCAMAGITLVLGGAGGTGGFDPVGAALSLGSALVYTCYILVGDRVVGDVPAVPLTALICTGALVTCTGISLLAGGPDLSISAEGWGWLLALVVISTVGAILLFFAGLARTGPTVAALVCVVEPVVTVVSAALAFGEQLTAIQGLGGVLVLVAVAVVQAPGPRTGPGLESQLEHVLDSVRAEDPPPCRQVGLDWMSSAPSRFSNDVDIALTPDELFGVLARADTWPRWAKVIKHVEYTSPEPHGVGTTRVVTMAGGMVGDEEFLAWEPGRRMAFRFNTSATKTLRAFLENYRLEPITEGPGAGGTRLTWELGMETTGPSSLFAPVSTPITNLMFRRFLKNLQTLCQDGVPR